MIRRLFLVFCTSAMLCVSFFFLTSCKESAAFQQIIYNQDNQDDVVDDDALNDNQPENVEKADIYSVAEEQDAEKERHFDYSEALYNSRNNKDSAPAASAEYSAYAPDQGETGQTTGDYGADADIASGESPRYTGSSTGGTNSVSDGKSGESGSSEGDGSTGGYRSDRSNVSGDGSGIGKTVEGDDADSKIPDESADPDEETAASVIATGNAAILVQMLCGDDTLLACDEETLEAMEQYFPASELSSIEPLCDGPDDTIRADVVKGLNREPSYFFYDVRDYNQDSALNCSQSGTDPVALDFRYADGISNAVRALQDILPSAEEKADDWLELYDEITSNLGETIGTFTGCDYSFNVEYSDEGGTNPVRADNTRSSGLYTIFIDGWDDNASITFSLASSGYEKTVSGVAAVTYGYTGSPVSHFMSIAGVSNRAASANWSSSTATRTYYLYNFGFTSCSVNIKPDSSAISWERSNDGSINQLADGLGGTDFPAVVAATQEIAGKLETDRDSEGSWALFDYLSNTGTGKRGFYTVGNSSVISVIQGEYEIYTNPSGLGDWAGGSAESILEAPWIASKFYPDQAYSEDNVVSLISDFYRRFYRCELSEGQIGTILAGKMS